MPLDPVWHIDALVVLFRLLVQRSKRYAFSVQNLHGTWLSGMNKDS